MKNEMVTLKILLPQSSIQLRLTQKKASEITNSLRTKSQWIDLSVGNGQILSLKSENVMGYEFNRQSSRSQDGLMTIKSLAESFGIHPVSLSRLIAQGKIPAVSSEGKKRKHSQANLDTALALRDLMLKQNKETLSESEIKKLFT